MFRSLTPVVRALLYLNFIVYALQRLTGYGIALEHAFALWPVGGDRLDRLAAPFEPWQLVTYAFLHDPSNWLHILSNMFALWMFGPAAEWVLGSRRFGFYYFACVIGAALTQLFVEYTMYPNPSSTVGASGGIMGVLLLFGAAFPRQKILLYFAIPMPAWLFVTLYGLYEFWLGIFGSSDGVAHFAHIGGMLTGLLLVLLWHDRVRDATRPLR